MEEKKDCIIEEKKDDIKPKKRNVSIYLKKDIYEKLMMKHNTSFIPVSKLVELALIKELG